MDEISGSTGLSGAADGVLLLKRDRGRGDAYLHVDGRDIEEPAELALTWNPNTACWTLAGDADEFRLSRERAAILRVLKEHGEPITPTEVADALGKNPNTVKQRLWRMSKDGQVSAADGRYSTITRNPHNHDNPDAVTGVTGVTGGSADPSPKATPRQSAHPRLSTEEANKVRVLLADPPPKLSKLLDTYGKDPAQFERPTSEAVAEHAFGDAERWREVVPFIEAEAGVLRLIDEGMSPKWARAEVWGEGL